MPGIDKQKLLVIGKGLSFGALRGLVWRTVYHSCSIQTNIRGLHMTFYWFLITVQHIIFFCNPILFAICTGTCSKLCKNVYNVM
jgi:hypothetical protein